MASVSHAAPLSPASTDKSFSEAQMEDPRLACLIDSHIAGVLNAEERAELEHLLASSPAAREQFDRHVALHALLHGAARVAPPPAPEPVQPGAVPRRPLSRMALGYQWLRTWQAALAGAATLLVTGGAW